MNVTAEQVAAAAQQLAAVAGVFSPQNAAALALLVQTVTGLNILIQQIRAQTDANKNEVWQQVETKFEASVLAFEASTQRKMPLPKPKPA